jgi:simple sugar transport system permease protein
MLLRSALVAAAALAVFALVLLAAGKSPLKALLDTFQATLASGYGVSELLVRMTPLLLTAVAVALPSRLGLINVGGEGQLYMGAWLASAGVLACRHLPLPAGVFLPMAALLGFLGGAAWAALPGVLRAFKLVNETIATLLLNYVAPLIVSYFVFGPWRSTESSAYPQSARFPDAALLPTFFDTRVHAGLLIALAALAAYWFLLERTRWGVDMRAIGGNPEAAQRLGLPVAAWVVAALALGGGFAGLAGMGEAMGIHGRLREGLSPGYGFTGFLISWLAGGRPLGILLMAFLFAILTSAGDTLQITQGLPYSAINILLGVILFIVLAGRKR